MTLIGPLEYKKFNHAVVALTENSIYIVELNILSTIKIEINSHLPFLFSDQLEFLNRKNDVDLLQINKTLELKASDIISISILGRHWGNILLILHKDKEYRFAIINREKTDEYIQIFTDMFNAKFQVIDEQIAKS